jgi:hypothetical protein
MGGYVFQNLTALGTSLVIAGKDLLQALDLIKRCFHGLTLKLANFPIFKILKFACKFYA